MPVAFDAGDEREILRALDLAREFKLDPIIVGGLEASTVVDDLKAAKARVIYSLNFQAAGGRAGGGGRGGPGGDVAIRTMHTMQNAPKVPAALEKAGVTFAFASDGQATPADFVRNVARTVKEGGLAADAALRALTIERGEDRRRRRSPRHDRERQDREPARHRGRSVRQREGEVRAGGWKSGEYRPVDKFEVRT